MSGSEWRRRGGCVVDEWMNVPTAVCYPSEYRPSLYHPQNHMALRTSPGLKVGGREGGKGGRVRGARCVARGAWRAVRGAWCVVRGAWCVVYRVGVCSIVAIALTTPPPPPLHPNPYPHPELYSHIPHLPWGICCCLRRAAACPLRPASCLTRTLSPT